MVGETTSAVHEMLAKQDVLLAKHKASIIDFARQARAEAEKQFENEQQREQATRDWFTELWVTLDLASPDSFRA
ncbi:hypothetical protein Slin15195_G045370 [Septoria linicola]|uniref:Uncharacterized protein n=1 Tax=Septoria linicola TaxID=215465 RepID=A0A9Q9AQG7_9PEZI|nr:hypothetical protein Slin14017_G048890 [Septoria linicola]USW51218.1 hypothetical protein Slin15195_G045370 [Septoria linicola]